MHRIHAGFTMTAVIKCGESAALKALLNSLNQEPNQLTDFSGSSSLFFLSGVILPLQVYLPNTSGKTDLPETLVLATSFCGPLDNHLEELVKKSGRGLFAMFSHCKDFTSSNPSDEKALLAYLKSHRLHNAFNSRYSGITKADVQKEKQLKCEIEMYIDKANKLSAFYRLSPAEIKKLIQRHITTRGEEYDWAHKPARKSVREFFAAKPQFAFLLILFGFWAAFYFVFPAYFLYGLCTFLELAVAVILLFIVLAWYIGSAITKPALRPSDDHVREIAATQLQPVLNEMTATGPLKAGVLRRYFYATALRVIGMFAPLFMNVPTVSSIRWLVTDNKRRLLFLSNYSNSTDFYVRDFLNGTTPRGVNFMFTNGQGFPDAKFLFKGGIADHPEAFMDAVHTGQTVTDLWYRHERNLTVDIINKNREIRNGLFAKMNEDETRSWISLL
jgi:VIT1/CCC1 family predicted Fe2+/Mn2+ transporter